MKVKVNCPPKTIRILRCFCLWSKSGDPSLKAWSKSGDASLKARWIMAHTSSGLTHMDTKTEAGNDNTQRLKLASYENTCGKSSEKSRILPMLEIQDTYLYQDVYMWYTNMPIFLPKDDALALGEGDDDTLLPFSGDLIWNPICNLISQMYDREDIVKEHNPTSSIFLWIVLNWS